MDPSLFPSYQCRCGFLVAVFEMECMLCGADRETAAVSPQSPEGAVFAFRALCFHAAPEFANPSRCGGLCGTASLSFLSLLDGLGIEARNVQLWTEDAPHVVTLIGDYAIDWTARQFQPTASFPRICPMVDLLASGWRIIGDQTPNRQVAD